MPGIRAGISDWEAFTRIMFVLLFVVVAKGCQQLGKVKAEVNQVYVDHTLEKITVEACLSQTIKWALKMEALEKQMTEYRALHVEQMNDLVDIVKAAHYVPPEFPDR